MKLRIVAAILSLFLATSFLLGATPVAAANAKLIKEFMEWILRKADDVPVTPKHADDAPSMPKLADEFLVTPKQADDLPLVSDPKSIFPDGSDIWSMGRPVLRAFARAMHNRACPSNALRVSLPQLNTKIDVPPQTIAYAMPGTNQPISNVFKEGTYLVDLLETRDCWVQIRYSFGEEHTATGWVYAELLQFEFDDHLTMPRTKMTKSMDAEGVYKLVAESVYMVVSGDSQGSAVAISPTVLLTNCHVLGKRRTAEIIIGSGEAFGATLTDTSDAILIHDRFSQDKCFIRSLEHYLDPVPNISLFSEVYPGKKAFSIGAPRGLNRTIADGIVSAKRETENVRWVQNTAPISPGSSGGGLFDEYANLIGITTLTLKNSQSINFAIAAEDFWR